MTAFGELLALPLRSGVTVPAAKRGSGIRMVNMRELFAHPRLGNVEMARVEVEGDPERYHLAEGDLLFARRSLTAEGAGQCAMVVDVREPTTWESSILRARPDRQVTDPSFLYYYFRSPAGRLQMDSIVNQVAAAGIRGSDLKLLDIPQPPLAVQQGIAEVLGALDDKIAANGHMMNAADDLIRASYTQLSSSENAVLDDIARSVRQQVGVTDIAANAVYVGLEHFDRERLWLQRFGVGGDVTSAKNIFEAGDTLFGKLRPYFHKVGVAPTNGVCSTDVLVIRALERMNRWLVAAASSSAEAIARAVQNSNGTRMPRAKWEDIADLVVPDPGSREAMAFEGLAESLGKRCFAAVAENETLTKTRDELLPLLMSGKISVRDAEKRVEGVV